MGCEGGATWGFMKRRGRGGIRRAGLRLNQVLQQVIERRLDPWPLVADLVIERLRAHGVPTSPDDRRAVEKALRNSRFDTLRLKGRRSGIKPVTVTLTEADSDAIAALIHKRAIEPLPSVIRATLEKTAPAFLSMIRRTYPVAIRADERRYRRQEASIARAWRVPLGSLALLIDLACRMMRTIDDYGAEHPATQPKLLHVLARLHIRSVHVAREILTLLRCGYPDAAMARWRTLHELATVMCLLSDHGEECAVCYLDHQAVQEFEDAKRYQEAAEGLGRRQLSAVRYAKLRAARDAVVSRPGTAFRYDYGWAATSLNSKRPTFAAIEKAVGRSHLRPYYRLASDNLHAGIMGALYKLGTIQPGKLLLEPTPVGLEEPGQNTALTLALVLAQLLRVCPALDALVIARTALSVADEAVEQFVSVGQALEVTTEGSWRRRKRRSRQSRP